MTDINNNKKIDDSWIKIFKDVIKKSTSLSIIVFGGVLIIISIWTNAEWKYVVASFFTLFYAIINHFLSVFSKTESIRPYARRKWTFLLYVTISNLLLVGYIALTTALLLADDMKSFRNSLENQFHYPSLLWIWFLLEFLLYFIWVDKIYLKIDKDEHEKQGDLKDNESYYEIKCFCKNCNDKKDIKIPKTRPFTDYPCPDCKVLALISKEEKLKNLLETNKILELIKQDQKLTLEIQKIIKKLIRKINID